MLAIRFYPVSNVVVANNGLAVTELYKCKIFMKLSVVFAGAFKIDVTKCWFDLDLPQAILAVHKIFSEVVNTMKSRNKVHYSPD
jgi:hypothetical protein